MTLTSAPSRWTIDLASLVADLPPLEPQPPPSIRRALLVPSTAVCAKPLPHLPIELVATVLAFADPATLAVACRVGWDWLREASPVLYETVVIDRHDAFEGLFLQRVSRLPSLSSCRADVDALPAARAPHPTAARCRTRPSRSPSSPTCRSTRSVTSSSSSSRRRRRQRRACRGRPRRRRTRSSSIRSPSRAPTRASSATRRSSRSSGPGPSHSGRSSGAAASLTFWLSSARGRSSRASGCAPAGWPRSSASAAT